MVSYSGAVRPGGSPDTRKLGSLTITKVAVDEQMSNNAYLLRCHGTGEQVLIDAAAEPERLLALVGGKMLWEAVFSHEEADEGEPVPDGRDGIGLRELLVLAVATSIDALAVGISLAFLEVSIVGAVVAIGVITFAVSFAGVVIGHRAGVRFRRPAEIAGGLILILIGLRILLTHLGIL